MNTNSESPITLRDVVGFIAGVLVGLGFMYLTVVLNPLKLWWVISTAAAIASLFLVRTLMDPRTPIEKLRDAARLRYDAVLQELNQMKQTIADGHGVAPEGTVTSLGESVVMLDVIINTGDESLRQINSPDKAAVLKQLLLKFTESFTPYVSYKRKKKVLTDAAFEELHAKVKKNIRLLETALENFGNDLSATTLANATIAGDTFEALVNGWGLSSKTKEARK